MEKFVYGIGVAGQFFFSCRILVQWIASERAGNSVVPKTFWVFSILGSVLLLAYAILRKDPVFTLGQAFGLAVYLRNIHLLKTRPANGMA